MLTFSDLLKSMPIFFHLREEELRAFEAQCEVVEVEEDQVLLAEGSNMSTVYIIANGVVTMTRDKVAMKGAGGVPEVITTLSRGISSVTAYPAPQHSVQCQNGQA